MNKFPRKVQSWKMETVAARADLLGQGISNVIASDNGTNFAVELDKGVRKKKRMGSQRFTTPGYPQFSSFVERFNRTLKNMLYNVIRKEVRQQFTVVLYSPSKYLKKAKSKLGELPSKPNFGIVGRKKMTYYHNLRSSDRVFKMGDQVIVFIPNLPVNYFGQMQGPATSCSET
ncbi:hypothetical protein NPIL_31711 [Nephila pilipes]|uniref:Integrase catalytic domain-containing protein n=1 Tax=Nephila pilipes TaxID=299642 RepID=A0A8X6UIW2_NEPPI|nr:hypothetical protein NPIL_31711 [Nephila pilipes]